MSALEAWPDSDEIHVLKTASVLVFPADTPASTVRLLGELAALVEPRAVLYTTVEPINRTTTNEEEGT